MEIIDISVPVGPNTPMWDDAPSPKLRIHSHLASGDTATVSSVLLSSHAGTHVDAPAHFVAGAATIDEIDTEALVGPAVVVQHTGTSHITARDLDELGIDGSCPRVLFKTRNGSLWDKPGFQRDFIGITLDAAQRLVEREVCLVAIDYLSIEAYEAADCPVHTLLLSAGIVLVEGVDLRAAQEGEYLLVCAPLKLEGAEGAPARLFLLRDRGGDARDDR